MSERHWTRRSLVRDAATLGAGFTIVPRRVLGGPGYQAPSDTLNIACIGVGGKGTSDVQGVAGENIYALCDVDERRAETSFRRFPAAKRYVDFREMLDRERGSIDAVTVSTPDHTHAAASIMAMRMGKHVFCQKPLARTVEEVREMRRLARDTGVATQMGNQGHAGDGTRVLREWIEAGVVGTVREVHFWTNRPIWPQGVRRPLEQYHVPPHMDWEVWLGPAPHRPFHPDYAPFSWRGWWDFGTGAMGDMACHGMDAAFWILDLGYPSRVEAETTTRFRETAPAASRVEYAFPARGDRPAVRVVWRDGGITPALPEELAMHGDWPIDAIGGQLWVGDDGALLAGMYGEDPRLLDADRHAEVAADPPDERYDRSPGVYAEWIRASKGGAAAGSTFDGYAGPLTEMVLLGNLAVRAGRAVEIEPSTGELITRGIPEEYLRPRYRAGWTL